MDITLSHINFNVTNRDEALDRIFNDIDFLEQVISASGAVLMAIGDDHKLVEIIEIGENTDVDGMNDILVALLVWVLDNKNEFRKFLEMFETE